MAPGDLLTRGGHEQISLIANRGPPGSPNDLALHIARAVIDGILSGSAACPVELLKITCEDRPFQAEHRLADSDLYGLVVASSGEHAQQVAGANHFHDAPKVGHWRSVGLEGPGVEIIRWPSALAFIGVKHEPIQALGELIAAGEMTPPLGPLLIVNAYGFVGCFCCAPLSLSRPRQAVCNVIAELLQHSGVAFSVDRLKGSCGPPQSLSSCGLEFLASKDTGLRNCISPEMSP